MLNWLDENKNDQKYMFGLKKDILALITMNRKNAECAR